MKQGVAEQEEDPLSLSRPRPRAATEFPPAGSSTSLSAAPEGVKTDNLRIAGLKASWAPS